MLRVPHTGADERVIADFPPAVPATAVRVTAGIAANPSTHDYRGSEAHASADPARRG